MGKLLAGQGKSRYIDSNIWRSLGDDALQRLSGDEEEKDQIVTDLAGGFILDPLTGALLGSEHSLLHHHPNHAEATVLWKTHIENVEPLCKILHISSTLKMVEMVSQQREMALKATLMQRYHYTTRQALVNASFLKTTKLPVLQALVLFLLPYRHFYDPHTY
jgi:hypothetical protein